MLRNPNNFGAVFPADLGLDIVVTSAARLDECTAE